MVADRQLERRRLPGGDFQAAAQDAGRVPFEGMGEKDVLALEAKLATTQSVGTDKALEEAIVVSAEDASDAAEEAPEEAPEAPKEA